MTQPAACTAIADTANAAAGGRAICTGLTSGRGNISFLTGYSNIFNIKNSVVNTKFLTVKSGQIPYYVFQLVQAVL